MSASLARRTGGVGALVVVALVVGTTPVLAAPPADPPRAAAHGAGGGREVAPGQQRGGSSPAVGPPTGVGAGPDATAAAPSSGPAEPAPTTKPAAAKPAAAKPAAAKPGAAKPAAAKPAAAKPAAAKPGASTPTAEDAATTGQGRGRTATQAPATAGAAGPPVAAPRSVRPAVGPVKPVVGPVPVRAATPTSVPVMGPHVPWTSRPTTLATAGSRSDRARAVAAAPVPVRQRGTEPIVLPAVRPQPRPVALGEALPTFAVQTVGAVARTPEWPLGIGVVVLLFLLVQNRIDRRDPKLATTRLEDEAPLEFAPLPGRPDLRRVVAA